MPEISSTDASKIQSNSILKLEKGTLSDLTDVDPKLCKPWKYHNRDETWLSNEFSQDLIQSIKKNGQLEPVLLREADNDPKFKYEIIFGVRRWFACSQLNQSLLSRITEADDKTCMVLMHTENAQSKDITEFERAFSFAQQMKSGVFKTQSEMAEMMGLTQGYISKLIKAGEIFEYSWIKDLFQNKCEIPIKYAYELSVLLKRSKHYDLLKNEAEIINSEKLSTKLLPTANTIFKRLLNVHKPEEKSLGSVIITSGEKPVISCSKDKLGKVSLHIESEAKALNQLEIEEACLKAIREYVFK